MPANEAIHTEQWLRHLDALSRLAASLLRDEHEAEDLIQETWLRARGDEGRKGTRWYRTVLRNLARDRMRERGRRASTERAAARDECVPSDVEIVARLEVVQRVAAEVARLPEPYRTAVHLRWLEDRSPEEIARLCGEPLETVRTRLRRGLEKLRERLDAAHAGSRDAWMIALTPIATRGGRAIGTGLVAGPTLAGIGVLMSTKLVIAGAAAVLAAVLFVAWKRLQYVEAQPEAIVSGEAAVRDSELRTRIAGALAATRTAAAQPLAIPAGAAASTSVESLGSVVVEDERGDEHANESGTLTIVHFTSEADAVTEDIEFVDGSWHATIPVARTLVVVQLVAGSREVLLPEPRPIVPGPDPIVVRGKWLARGWLRVVDGTTKQELRDVEIRSVGGWRGGPQMTHPGDLPGMKAVISDGASPVELPEGKYLDHYWVHAPDHAWARVDFDHRVGGQRTVELSPLPASVCVAITGGSVPENAWVRLYREDRVVEESGFRFQAPDRPHHVVSAVSVRASAPGPTCIQDFHAGRFVAAVEVGEYEVTMRLGEAPVEVEPGGAASVTVPIDPALLEVPRTHLSGTIELAEGMERRTTCSLRLQRIGGGEKTFSQPLAQMSFLRGDESHLRFDAGLVRTGDYVACMASIQHHELIHASGPGETKVAIVIPPLVTVRVDVVDAQSGAKVQPQSLDWTGSRREGIAESEYVPILPDPRTGRWQFTATSGDATVRCQADGYEDAEQKLSLDGREVDCTVALNMATGIHVSLIAGGDAPLAPDFLSDIRAFRDGEAKEATGVTRGRTTATATTRFLRTPGRYRIEFPKLKGFEPMEPRVVDVRAGEMVDVTVAPQRRK